MTFKVIRGQGPGQEMTSVPYRDYFLIHVLEADSHASVAAKRLAGKSEVFCVKWNDKH